MKLYSPGNGVKINVDKEQAQIMLDAGWTKEPPIKKDKAVKETSNEDPSLSADPEEALVEELEAEIEDESPAPAKRRRITKKD